MTQASGNIHTDVFSLPQIIEAMERFSQTRILIIGDVMIDEYLTGDADRISPEAPVPIVKVESEKLLVGGAGNVARNITALRGQACLVGVRGTACTKTGSCSRCFRWTTAPQR
jgi:ADP-heptose synthase, bifunctional sugar kinase/adenylyltransferase